MRGRVRAVNNQTLTVAFASAMSLVITAFSQPSQCREQWQMQHPEGAAPTGPVTKGYVPPAPGSVPGLVGSGNSASSGMAPGLVAPVPSDNGGIPQYSGKRAISDEIIQQMLTSRIGVGSVLTGTLGDDISSKKSHPGDLFSIVLTDGHSLNGHELIPRGSRIIGKVVMTAPAASQKQPGMVGTIEVGLSTLVFPDGRSTPFTGFIERNPAHTMKKPPVSRGPGMSLSDYKNSVGSMFGSFTSGIGGVRRRTNRGKDLLLQEGDVVPIRLTRSIDLTKMSPPTVPPTQPLNNPFSTGGSPAGGSTADSSAQAMAPNMPSASAPNLNAPGANPYSPNTYNSGQQPLLPKELPDPF